MSRIPLHAQNCSEGSDVFGSGMIKLAVASCKQHMKDVINKYTNNDDDDDDE